MNDKNFGSFKYENKMRKISEERSEDIRDELSDTKSDLNKSDEKPDYSAAPATQGLWAVWKKKSINHCNCGIIYYCSLKHQRQDWKNHKDEHIEVMKTLENRENEKLQPYDPRSSKFVTRTETYSDHRRSTFKGVRRNSKNSKRKTLQTDFKFDKKANGKEEIFNDIKNAKKEHTWEKILYWQYKGKNSKMLEEAKQNYESVYSDYEKILQDESGATLFDIRRVVYDILLYAKALVINHEFNEAIKPLNQWVALLKTFRINTQEVVKSWVTDKRENKLDGNEELGSVMTTTKKSIGQKGNRGGTQTYSSFKMILSTYSAIAALYSRCGNQRKAEQVYEKYITEVSKAYIKYHGTFNIPTSDCFFWMGVFYMENDMNMKAEKWFEKALYIRKNFYQTEYHPSWADCYYNLSVIYKKRKFLNKAQDAINDWIKIRIETIGKESLPVADAFEQYAKLMFYCENYKGAINAIEKWFEIRKKIIPDSKHPDIARVTNLVIYFYKIIDEKSQKSKLPKKSMMFDLNEVTNKVDIATDIDNIKKLIRLKIAKDLESKAAQEKREAQNLDITYTIIESNPDISLPHISESRDASRIINDGLGTIFELFEKEDKTSLASYVVTFVLTLTDEQLDDLNKALYLIKPGMVNGFQEFDMEFVQKLTRFQIDLLKKSNIWSLNKASYLDVSKISRGYTPEQRRRYIQSMRISPENLLIVERSPHYDHQLLEAEIEEDQVIA